jgi:hypothetical protein
VSDIVGGILLVFVKGPALTLDCSLHTFLSYLHTLLRSRPLMVRWVAQFKSNIRTH